MTRLRDNFVDGLLLALPIIVAVYVLARTIALIVKVLSPLTRLVPEGHWLGVVVVDVVATATLVLAIVALGAFARSAMGHWVSQTLERVVLNKIPGFPLFKSLATGFASESHDQGLIAALITFDDNMALGFVVEWPTDESGLVTVFIPSAPTPAAGNVVLVPRTRVTLLDVSTSAAIGTVVRLGLGLEELIRPAMLKSACKST
jgi:uncharacterized membrane protein